MSATADDRSRVLDLGGDRTVGIAEYGDLAGWPVLAFHGAPACRTMFARAHQDARTRGVRLIAPDRPGYGLTPPVDGQTIAREAETMERLADALGLGRLSLLGISGGAPYAAATAVRLGGRIDALGLVSPVGPLGDPEAARALHPAQRMFFLGLPRHDLLLRAGAWLAHRAFEASADRFVRLAGRMAGSADRAAIESEEVRTSAVAFTREALVQGVAGGLADMRVYAAPWRIDLGRVAAPAVVWIGTADRIVPISAARRLAGLIPRCRLIEPDGAGHFWVLDHAGEVLDALAGLRAAAG